MDEGDVANLQQAPREVVERGGPRPQRRAGDPRSQLPQRLEVVVERDERVGLLGGRRTRRIDDDERPHAQAPSKGGWVTAGSARQATTSSARSRISPKVAVLDPIAWYANGAAPESITAPNASASATARRCASQLVRVEPVDEWRARLAQDRRRGLHRLVEAHLAAVDAGDRRPLGRRKGVAERARQLVVARRQRQPSAGTSASRTRAACSSSAASGSGARS